MDISVNRRKPLNPSPKIPNQPTSVKTIMKAGSSTHIYYQGWQVNHISTMAVKQYEGQQFVFINPSSFLLYFKKTQIIFLVKKT